MKKKIAHLFWLLNVRIALKQTSLHAGVKKDVYKSFMKCYRLLKQNNNAAVMCRIGGYDLKSADPALLQLLLREIMINEQYLIELKTDSPFIIDCGANIGCSVLYFKLKFPNARIVAVEANPETFKILSENVKQFKDVTVINGFVHNTGNATIELYTSAAGDVSASSDPERGGPAHTTVNTISLQELAGTQKVDLLKMDIEGGEFAIFNKKEDLHYLGNVKNILLEYHHLINNKMGNSLGEFLSVFETNGFIYNISASVLRKGTPYFQDIFIKMKKETEV